MSNKEETRTYLTDIEKREIEDLEQKAFDEKRKKEAELQRLKEEHSVPDLEHGGARQDEIHEEDLEIERIR